jgi:hypothetical protein
MVWLRNNIVTIIFILICVAGVVIYRNFMSGTGSDVSTSDVTVSGEQMLVALNRLRAISLDPTFFSDPTFLSLVDFGQVISPQPVGRPNPFAPIGLRLQNATGGASAAASGH